MVKPIIGNVYIFDSADISLDRFRVQHNPVLRPVEDECFALYDDALKADIAKRLEGYRTSPNEFDGTLLCLDDFLVAHNGDRVLKACDIKYSTYQALKTRLAKEPDHKRTLTRVVPLIAIVETIDDKLVFGYRSTNHMEGLYLPPAGFSDHKGTVPENYFAGLTVEEVEEEVGISPKELRYVGISSGDDSRNLTVVTFAKLAKEAHEIDIIFGLMNARLRDDGKKVEHDHMLYVPTDPESIAAFLCSRYTGCLNQNRNIRFENGTCVAGTEKILGKEYGQIGNGIAAVLALMKQRMPKAQFRDLVAMVEESKVVDKVEELSLAEKFGSLISK